MGLNHIFRESVLFERKRWRFYEKMRVKIAGGWEREMGKWRQVRKDAVRNLQGNSAELASVESKKRGVRKKKCSFSRFFITLGSYPPIYIYRDASQREPAGRSTRAETSTPHPNLRSDGKFSLWQTHAPISRCLHFLFIPKRSVTKHLARCSGETAYSDVVFPNLQHLVLRFVAAERFR